MNNQAQNMNNETSNLNSFFNLDANRLHSLASSIMKSNKLEEVAAYEELLHSYESLSQVLACLCQSKEIYFVTSQLILRMLKTNVNEMRLKISNSLVMMMNQSFSLEEYKIRSVKMYKIIQDTYIQVIAKNVDSLQKYEHNQALEIIALSISELFNISSEEDQPHINLIAQLFDNYYQSNTQNNILGFLLNYEPFDTITQNKIVIPSNVKLYKSLLNIMAQVIEMKQNWEDHKYTQSQILVNHRQFKNKFLTEWAEFTVKQAKMVLNLFLEENTSFFSALVLPDILKLLHRILTFSYESPNLRTYEWIKDKFVKYPQYTFPEGILKSLGSDHTFLQTLHRVYTKIVKLFEKLKTQENVQNKQVQNAFSHSKQNEVSREQNTTLEMCQFVLSIYGRVFFLTVEQDLRVQPKQFQGKSMNNTVSASKYLNFTKVSILSQMLQNPHLYFCNRNSQKLNQSKGLFHAKQKHILYFAIIQIVTQFITYSYFDEKKKIESNTNQAESMLRMQIKKKMKHFLVVIMTFVSQFLLKDQCWFVLYGKDECLDLNEIFTENRNYELTFSAKIFELIFQCHKFIEIKFLDPKTQAEDIKNFYQQYFKIADQFLGTLQSEFTTNISKLNIEDFNLEYNFLMEIVNSLPYVKIKENKFIKPSKQDEMMGDERMMGNRMLKSQMGDLESLSAEEIEGEKVLDYFQMFDQLIVNLNQSLAAKIQSINVNKESISFMFYLSAILIDHYLSNSNFYSKHSVPLIRLIKDLLKITFQYNQQIKAPSMFAFYEKIVEILSQKSLNSRELLNIIFEVQQQTMSIEPTISQNNQTQFQLNIKQFKNKNTVQRSLDLVRKLMKSTCQRLMTKDIKQLDSALIVLETIFKEFQKNSFAVEFGYLKEFFQNFMNSADSLFSQSKNISRKLKFIEIVFKFLQLKSNNFSSFEKFNVIESFNNVLFMSFKVGKSIDTLMNYFLCIQKMISSYDINKLFVIDVFYCTIKDFIQDINKNYRKLIKENINFFEATKCLLLRILQVVELFGGQKWGTKYVENQDEQDDEENNHKLYHSMYDKGNNDLFKSVETVNWEQNQRDDELPLITEEYFYTWVKQLGREEYETQNAGTWTKQKKEFHNKDLISIYAQYLHLTPNGKLPPLPKALVEQERKKNQAFQLQKQGEQCPDLDDFSPNETRTTKLLIRLYIQNFYRVSNTTLMAIYPSIDYRLEYVRKWWDEIMIRGLRPEINVSFVYQKFVIYGHNCQMSQNNRLLAELYFKIANFYKDDAEFLQKYVSEPYQIKSVTTYTNNENCVSYMGTKHETTTISEQKKNYVNRILFYWRYSSKQEM